MDENGLLTTELTEDITIYAHYKPGMKYAVAIYDIGVDALENGEAGLTFGPALGANYVMTHKEAHTPTGQTENKNGYRCVHNDSWTTIIEWNTKDPYVYEQCIENGCTKSVVLSKNSTTTILDSDFNTSTETGDGPSVLYYELVVSIDGVSTSENLRWHPNGGKNGTNVGGWGASRIRAMLNGADLDDSDGIITDIDDSNYPSDARDINTKADIYTEQNCLLATLPQELQKAIGKKAVKYDSDCYKRTEDYLKISYDKLWLFSPNELASSCNWRSDHPLEGVKGVDGNTYPYVKMKNRGDFTKSNEQTCAYRVNSSSGQSFWLRSNTSFSNYSIDNVNGGGAETGSYGKHLNGIAFGFTLAR